MKFIKKLTLVEAVEALGEFEEKNIGTSSVVYHDAIENMKRARELADERLKEQNKEVKKPVDGTAKGGKTTIKNVPEAKKLKLSEDWFDDVQEVESEEDWYDMYAFIMDSFTEGGLDYKQYKILKAVPKQYSVGCTAPDDTVDAINHFPIGVDNDDNIVVNCSNEDILNAYIKCAEDYKLEYKTIDNKKPGAYNNFTIKVKIPRDSIGQVACIGDYFESKGIPLSSVLGYTDNHRRNSFALYLAKSGELFANPDDNETYVKEHAPVRTRVRRDKPSDLEQEVAIADAAETPVEEAVQEKLSLSARLKRKLGIVESVSARPNSDRLFDMIDAGVVDTVKLSEELILWLPDDSVGEFAREYEYFSETSAEESLTEGKEVTFTIDGKEYKGTCVGDASTKPGMCDVRIGKEYYNNEENIALRKGIYNPHEDRDIKDGKFFIPKSELKECGLTEAYVKSTLNTFQPWEDAITTWQLIKENDKFAQFEQLIEEMYPEGIEKTSLNDLLSFEKDWVLDMLHIPHERAEEDAEVELSEE